MTIIPTLILPGGHSTMGAPPPCLALSADGRAFYGVQTKGNGSAYAFRVYVQEPGTAPATPIETGIRGQGRLNETCGLLVASGCAVAGDGKPVTTFVVPGFVGEAAERKEAIVITPDSAIGRLFTGVYAPADLDTPAEVALRVSKQLAAIHQLVGLLETAGVVRRA